MTQERESVRASIQQEQSQSSPLRQDGFDSQPNSQAGDLSGRQSQMGGSSLSQEVREFIIKHAKQNPIDSIGRTQHS